MKIYTHARTCARTNTETHARVRAQTHTHTHTHEDKKGSRSLQFLWLIKLYHDTTVNKGWKSLSLSFFKYYEQNNIFTCI